MAFFCVGTCDETVVYVITPTPHWLEVDGRRVAYFQGARFRRNSCPASISSRRGKGLCWGTVRGGWRDGAPSRSVPMVDRYDYEDPL